jgi:hypothetical protein
MMTRFLCASLFVSASFLVGCDQQQSSTPPAAPEQSPSQGVGGAAMDQAQKTVGGVQTDAAKVQTDAAKTVDAAKTQTDAAAKAAEGQIQQVMDYIKANKLDLAEQALTKLEASKTSLPAAVQEKLPTARQALNSAKAAAGKLQNLPGLPK